MLVDIIQKLFVPLGRCGGRNSRLLNLRNGEDSGNQLLHQGIADHVIKSFPLKTGSPDPLKRFHHLELIHEDRVCKTIIVGDTAQQIIRKKRHIEGRARSGKNRMDGLSPQINALSFPQCIGLLIEGNLRFSALANGDLVIKVSV